MPDDTVFSQIPELIAPALIKPKPWWACPRCWMKTVQAILLVVLVAGAVFYMRPMWVIQQRD